MRNMWVLFALASATAACSEILGIGQKPRPADYDIRLRSDYGSGTPAGGCGGQLYCYVTVCATGMIGGTLHLESAKSDTHAASVTLENVSYSGTVTRSATSLSGQLKPPGAQSGELSFAATPTDSGYTGTWTQSTNPHGAFRGGKFAATLASATPPSITDPRTTTVTGVVINPSAATAMRVGGSVQLTARAVNVCGSAVTGQAYAWSTSNSSVATVGSDGSVAGIGAGSATITATSAGKTATRTVYVLSGDTLVASAVYAGDGITCALLASGAARCWGLVVGAKDDTTARAYTYPVAIGGGQTFASLGVQGVRIGETPGSIVIGHLCGVTPSDQAYCWGTNTSGELGDSTTTFRSAPTLVAGALPFTSISAGANYTCGITAAASVACWGNNFAGKLGTQAGWPWLTPSTVLGLSNVTSLATSFQATCAVNTAGAAFCWGDNSGGQLGDGTNTLHSTPEPVSGVLTFRSIAGAGDAFCGLSTDGTAYCWGSSQFVVNSSTPVAMSNGSMKFTQLTVGAVHACGLTATGDAYCWGGNYQGELGDGTTTNRAAPTLVSGGLHFSSIAAGGSHTCGLTVAGQVFCWGANAYGELGDLSTTQRNVPVPVSAGPPNQ